MNLTNMKTERETERERERGVREMESGHFSALTEIII